MVAELPLTSVTDATGDVASHIARTAARLFAARGYDATPVREIVAAAGVTKPTLYYYYGSKEGLAQALLTRPLTDLLRQMREAGDAEADPERALVRMLEAQFTFCVEDPDRARFVYALFFGPLGSSLAAELSRFGQDADAEWLRAGRRMAEAGRIHPDQLDAFVASLRGLAIVHTVDYLYQGVRLDSAVAERVITTLLQGFGVPRDRRS